MLGAAAALGDALGYVAPLREQERWKCAASLARASSGQQAYDAAWMAGLTLPPERAAAEAAAILASVESAPAPAATLPAGNALFSRREHDVLQLLVEGRSDREIAETLSLSYRTVTSHVRNILGKLDVASRTAAATQAVRRGLI